MNELSATVLEQYSFNNKVTSFRGSLRSFYLFYCVSYCCLCNPVATATTAVLYLLD